MALPSATAAATRVSASGRVPAPPPRISISAARRKLIRARSPSPCRPFKISTASITSIALPMARPSGSSIRVTSALTRRPWAWPTATMAWARARASSMDFMKAPPPHFTSSTSASQPPASFLAMMLAVMSGMDSTVAVTSRRA